MTAKKTLYGSVPKRTACPASSGYKQHESDHEANWYLNSLYAYGGTGPLVRVHLCKNCGSLFATVDE